MVRLSPYPEKLTDRLEHWANVAPERVFMAERDGAGWRTITYAQTLDKVRRIGAALLTRNLSDERPIAILSGKVWAIVRNFFSIVPTESSN